jgi:hypothetical protein
MPEREETEQTTPKGAKIPVLKRKDFYANLDKMVKAPSPPGKPKTATQKG